MRHETLTLPTMGLLALVATGCGDDDAGAGVPADLSLVAVTFNVGTTEGLPHDAPPDDGYGADEAALADAHYGNGLAWPPAIDAVRAWLAANDVDLVAFQEVFHSPDCAEVPADARTGFVCETWSPGDPTVVETVTGMGYQVACHRGRPDKCVAVHERLGRFRGCDGAYCEDGLDGPDLEGCGQGARAARAVVELVDGGALTVVSVHGRSGLSAEDQACRISQAEWILGDVGAGAPAADGEVNLVLGDLNTDPGRGAGLDASAERWSALVGDGRGFAWLTDVDPASTPTYAGAFSIDHVVSDRLAGDCVAVGVDPGTAPVLDAPYFDHVPIRCALALR